MVSETVIYAIYDDGSIEQQRIEGADDPILSKPGRLVSEEEYQQALSVLVEHHADMVTSLETAEQQSIRSDYETLIATGIPEGTARRLTGYVGE